MKTRKKKPTVKSLKKKADEVFSQYIRQRGVSADGLASCVSCGVVRPWKEMQCGHFVSRGKNSLRFNERNCHVQCPGCNVFKHGNYPSYARFMVEKYGQSILRDLEQESQVMKQWKTYELAEIIETYKDKIAKLT
jgi:hypothetical protein